MAHQWTLRLQSHQRGQQEALIGTEYPHDGYCWVNLTQAALIAGMTHNEIFEAQQASRDLIYNDSYIAAHLAEPEAA
jgi:hypothetical protein